MPKLSLYSAVAKPRSEPAIVGLLSLGTEQMPLDEPFPLDQFSPRVRTVIRNEFNGRCPSQQEVAEIPDARWLATPDIGPVLLKQAFSSAHHLDRITVALFRHTVMSPFTPRYLLPRK
jgi:hypothetical protein